MSKHCEVCDRSYPDELDACPHCADVVEIPEGDLVEFGEEAEPATQSAEEPDSAVDLGLPAFPVDASGSGRPADASGLSVIEWASLVQEGPAETEPAAEAFDAPSDAEPIGRPGDAPHGAAAAPPVATTDPTIALPPADGGEDALSADLEAVRTIFAGDASASFARRGPAHPPPAAPATPEADDSALNLLAPDVGESPPPAEPPAPKRLEPEVVETLDSGVDLAPAEPAEDAVGETAPRGVDSGVDLAEASLSDSSIDLSAPVGSDAPSDQLDVVEIVDSGVDLVDASSIEERSPAVVGPGARPISDSGIDLSGEEPTLGVLDSGLHSGIEQGAPGTSDSGVDRIAEEVESGTALPLDTFEVAGDSKVPLSGDAVNEVIGGESGTALAAGQLASEAEEVDLTEMAPVDAVESSAVDLGASATFPAAPPEEPSKAQEMESTRPYEARSKSIHAEPDETTPSEVNLGAQHGKTGDSGADFFEESAALRGTASRDAEDDEGLGLTADEEEAPAEVAEEEEAGRPARAKPEKRRSTAGAWGGGALVGALVATSACVVLWLFGVEPPKAWRGQTGGGQQGATATGGANGPPPAPATLADKMDMIRSGDFARASKADVETADESKPEEVAARGEFRVRNYLMQQSANQAPIKPDDEALKKGLDDLEKAKGQSDEALFWLGVTKEAANDLAGAQKVYQEGMDRFKDDPAKRRRFEDALNRLSAKLGTKPVGVGRAAPAVDAAWLALLLTTVAANEVQQPQPPAAQAAPAEAGSEFWQAVKLAHDHQYAEAVKALDQAAETHLKRRFSVLGKAQNPNSDPTEEIFVRSCEELKAYWQLQEKLHSSTLPVVKGKDPAAAVDALMAEDKDLADKLAKAAADGDAAKTDLETAKKGAEDAKKEAEAAKKDLETTKKDLTTAKNDVEARKNDLTAAEKKAADLAVQVKTAQEDAAKKAEALKGLAEALTPKFLKPDAGEGGMAAAVKEAVRLAAAVDPQGLIHSLEGEVAGLKSSLQERWAPDQMLSFWLPLLRERGRKDLADDAIKDADRVLKADKAPAAAKARAHAVKGLALRDQEKYAEAKAELDKAKADLPPEDGEWRREAETALRETADPSAYFLARADEFHKEGRAQQALAMLDRAMETAGAGAKGPALTKRGGWRLDAALAHARGMLSADDPDVAAARQDAEEAKKDGGAPAFYLSGRIAEAVGQYDAAAGAYRQALAAHPALDAEGAFYRAALARMLVLPRPARPTDAGKVSLKDGPGALEILAALVAVGLQPGDVPGTTNPATQEAQKLADEILSAKEGDVPFEARAQAYAIKGLWTQALTTYVDGLRPYLSPEHAAGLMAIIQGHPALQRPTLLVVANPLEAAKHYAAGLNWFNDREYRKAEKEFLTAVEHDGQDARYYYYLGLTRLMQGDRAAYEDFEQGARLEQRNRPPRAAVSASLERVQGPARERLNEVRDRPR